jgi:predicted transcriptional regulator
MDYLELLERNSHIVYPALAVITLGLVSAGVLQSLRSQKVDGATISRYKQTIVDALRRQPVGLPATALAGELGLDTHKTVRLLEQMQQDGVLDSYTNSQRITLWQVKGLSGRS